MDLQTVKLMNGKATAATGVAAFLFFLMAGGILAASLSGARIQRDDATGSTTLVTNAAPRH